MIDPIVVLLALAAGIGFCKLGYPPLLGYLVAGFTIHGLDLETGPLIDQVADAGVTLLLFTIGLKLNLRDLAMPQVWGVASLYTLMMTPLLAVMVSGLAMWLPNLPVMPDGSLWTLAFVLSFSSTVLAVKIFDERGDGAALHAKIAIGILIVQDLVAVIFLAFSTDKIPAWPALWLLLLIPLRPLLLQLFKFCGHGELLTLFGMGAAFGGYALFEHFEIKGDLGALLLGVLLGGHSKTNELAKTLLNLKELFLVGFFLSIGLNGFPSMEMLVFAVALGLAAVLKPLLFYGLLVAAKLRARTSMLVSLALFNYSEFGLIVAALAVSAGLLTREWLVTIALALSISYFIAVSFNARSTELYRKLRHRLYERPERIPDERSVDLGDASVIVLGMGRVGSGAYRYLAEIYDDKLVGVEEDLSKLLQLQEQGYNVVRGDADDRDFWEQVDLVHIELIMVSLTNHSENMNVCNLLDSVGYQGKLAVIARFPDEQQELTERGCIAFNLYAEAGHGFAEHVCEVLQRS